jgi:NAD(P)-dependent dehydrogenase (short-subunit alcohol dehydrogenase family)
MGEALAHELQPHGVTALTVTPGWLRSESMLDYFGVTEETWRKAAERVPYFSHSETPHLLGRGIAALAADPGIASAASASARGTSCASTTWSTPTAPDRIGAPSTSRPVERP